MFEALCPEIDFSDETIQKIQVKVVSNKQSSKSPFPGNPGNQHERNPIGCLGRGGCVRHGRHDGAQLHAQHQDDLRQTVQCQLCQHHPKSQFFYIILYGLHKSDIKCTMVDHREGGKGHLRGRTPLHHVHSCSLGNHRKV